MKITEYKAYLYRLQDGKCALCEGSMDGLPTQLIHLEHAHSRKHGGSDTLDNVQLACAACNSKKGPASEPVKRKRIPRDLTLKNPHIHYYNKRILNNKEKSIIGIRDASLAEGYKYVLAASLARRYGTELAEGSLEDGGSLEDDAPRPVLNMVTR